MASPMRPRQSELKRGASAAYHALYALARDCADLLVGTGDTRSDPAWAQVIGHSNMASRKIPAKWLPAAVFPAVSFRSPIRSSSCKRSVTT